MRKKILTIILLSIILIALISVGSYLSNNIHDDGVYTVVLDPGHGGHDPGAVFNEISEKDINLTIALMVQEKLNSIDNVRVFITRNKDEFVALSDRAQFANRHNTDLFVSIHANSLDDTSYAGIMTFFHPDKSTSKKPAKFIQTALIDTTGAIDRGVRNDTFTVLTETEMPAVLIETGFMSNSEELSRLIDPEYQLKIATGIANGILSYEGR